MVVHGADAVAIIRMVCRGGERWTSLGSDPRPTARSTVPTTAPQTGPSDVPTSKQMGRCGINAALSQAHGHPSVGLIGAPVGIHVPRPLSLTDAPKSGPRPASGRRRSPQQNTIRQPTPASLVGPQRRPTMGPHSSTRDATHTRPRTRAGEGDPLHMTKGRVQTPPGNQRRTTRHTDGGARGKQRLRTVGDIHYPNIAVGLIRGTQ